MTSIPRPASTVVLMDELSRVYLTRRPRTMKFMGGFHVFPGGAVEKGDFHINKAYLKMGELTESVDISYYIAAARELFEEVGILLAQKKNGAQVEWIKEKQREYRDQLSNGQVTFTELMEREDLYLNLESLAYFGRIITPEKSKIRFDTRFFLARIPQGQEASPNEDEIEDAFWIDPEEALKAFLNKEIRLAPPTILSLETVMNYRNGGALNMSVSEHDLLGLIRKYGITGIL